MTRRAIVPDANYGRGTCLSVEQIWMIRRAHAKGASAQALADAYCVSKRTIFRYVTSPVRIAIPLGDSAELYVFVTAPPAPELEAALRAFGQTVLTMLEP
jgi:hypothetical protein